MRGAKSKPLVKVENGGRRSFGGTDSRSCSPSSIDGAVSCCR